MLDKKWKMFLLLTLVIQQFFQDGKVQLKATPEATRGTVRSWGPAESGQEVTVWPAQQSSQPQARSVESVQVTSRPHYRRKQVLVHHPHLHYHPPPVQRGRGEQILKDCVNIRPVQTTQTVFLLQRKFKVIFVWYQY
jgi:hypothetical protein